MVVNLGPQLRAFFLRYAAVIATTAPLPRDAVE
jgi:hypothetical protein